MLSPETILFKPVKQLGPGLIRCLAISYKTLEENKLVYIDVSPSTNKMGVFLLDSEEFPEEHFFSTYPRIFLPEKYADDLATFEWVKQSIDFDHTPEQALTMLKPVSNLEEVGLTVWFSVGQKKYYANQRMEYAESPPGRRQPHSFTEFLELFHVGSLVSFLGKLRSDKWWKSNLNLLEGVKLPELVTFILSPASKSFLLVNTDPKTLADNIHWFYSFLRKGLIHIVNGTIIKQDNFSTALLHFESSRYARAGMESFESFFELKNHLNFDYFPSGPSTYIIVYDNDVKYKIISKISETQIDLKSFGIINDLPAEIA